MKVKNIEKCIEFIKKQRDILRQNEVHIFKTWCGYMGVVAGVLSIINIFMTWEDIGVKVLRIKVMILIGICIITLIISCIWICLWKKEKTIWKSSSGTIKVCYSDIIKDSFNSDSNEEKLCVIPVNTCFDTIVDEDISKCVKPLISPASVHGKWIKEMKKNGYTLKKIDKNISESLKNSNINPIHTRSAEEKSRGKREEYESGTIAVVRGKHKCNFLLLATAELDENNVAHATIECIEDCIKKLIEFYNNNGQCNRLIIPLMGTNLSRTGLSHNISLKLITSMLQLYGDKIHGEVDVIVYTGDKDKVTINI